MTPETYRDVLQKRYYLVTVFGTCVALIGIVNNLLLSYLFVAKLNFTKSHLFYLGVLCVVKWEGRERNNCSFSLG